jgi:hypothetical protein
VSKQEYKGGTIQHTYHPEFGGMVYQPDHPSIKKFIEPYKTEDEAKAFLEGLAAGEKK